MGASEVRRGLLAVGLVLAACGDRVDSPTPGGTAHVARDGIILTLALDRGDVTPGNELWATLTVENTTDREVPYTTGGCKTVGRIDVAPPQPDAGKSWPGVLGTFKSWALQHTEAYAYFVDEESWPQGRACPAAIWTEMLAPKTTLRSRWVWDGYLVSSPAGRQPTPASRVDVVGHFFPGRTSADAAAAELRVTVDLNVRGPADAFLAPGVAIDRAYADGRLSRWLEQRPAPSSGPLVGDIVGGIRLEGDVWRILGAQKVQLRGDEIEVRVAARDGKVLSVIER